MSTVEPLNLETTLAHMRGMHLPEPPGWFPPGPALWLTVLGVLVGLGALAAWLWWQHRQRPRRQAAAELERARALLYQNTSVQAVLTLCNQILRRFCMRCHGAECAALTGLHWLSFLDQVLGESAFSSGPGILLGDRVYSGRIDSDPERAIDTCLRLVLESKTGRRIGR